MSLNETAVIREFVREEMLCGSRVTCDPAPTGTDQDVLVRINKIYLGDVATILYRDGWALGGSGQQDSDFESWTKGEINLILVWDIKFYRRHACATALCKQLNLLAKDDRRFVFRAMLYGESPWSPPEVPGEQVDGWSPF